MPKEIFGRGNQFLGPQARCCRFEEDRNGWRGVFAGARRHQRSGSPAASRCCGVTPTSWWRASRASTASRTLTMNDQRLAAPPAGAGAGRRRADPCHGVARLGRRTRRFKAMNDVDFPVARVLEGIDAAVAAGLGPGQGERRREARRQTTTASRSWPSGFRGTGVNPPVHRVHGRRPRPTAGGSTTSSRRRKIVDRIGASWALEARRPHVARRRRDALALSRRRRRDRRHRVPSRSRSAVPAPAPASRPRASSTRVCSAAQGQRPARS